MSTLASRQRAEKVYYLRAVVQLSWRSIAEQCGFTSVGGAQRAYERHMKRNPIPSGEVQLSEILERGRFRNSIATQSILQAVKAADWPAVASLVRAQQASDAELAKLYGLHSPERHQVDVNVQQTQTAILERAEQELLALEQQRQQQQSNVIDAEVVAR